MQARAEHLLKSTDQHGSRRLFRRRSQCQAIYLPLWTRPYAGKATRDICRRFQPLVFRRRTLGRFVLHLASRLDFNERNVDPQIARPDQWAGALGPAADDAVARPKASMPMRGSSDCASSVMNPQAQPPD